MDERFEAVIFDLDGVITDTARYHYLAWKKIANKLKIPFDEAFNERLKGIDRLRSLELLLEHGSLGFSQAEKLRLAEEKNQYYQQLIGVMTPEDTLPGTLDLLKDLRNREIKIGLASISKNAGTVIERLGLAAFFDEVADAARIQRGKPDPEIFLTVAARLQVTPEKCIGVEDAVAGIRAIKAAGMYAVGVGDPLVLTEADEVISGLRNFETDKYFVMR